MKKQIVITYNWRRTDGEKINEEHIEALEESATERIIDMWKDGFTSGELIDNVKMTDTDPEDGIEYKGWWELRITTL